ncbi:MAG: 5-(carboxyamino)imidazole ribonucleotide synthase [Pseudomonadota bacterium]
MKTVGIIGDGQLGMLLCQAAPELNLDTVLLTSDADSPAARCATKSVVGTMDDTATLEALIQQCDVITYEREDVPPAAVSLLREAENAGRVVCRPSLDVIEMIQDKANQKRWFAENGLATLPFVIAETSPETLAAAGKELGFPIVQKALRGGFDGRGVQLLRSETDFEKAWPGETLLEKYAGEFRELAVLLVRSSDGDMRYFGPVDMTFETDYSVLDTVMAPAAVSDDIAAAAVQLAKDAIECMDGIGVFGVEMFLLSDRDVLINEISPRVHNAGHYTLEACATSQFSQHLRAVADLPLAETTLIRPGAMRNVLCTPALKAEDIHRPAQELVSEEETTTYWYGKSPARLMRKLGHVTALGDSADVARDRVDAAWTQIQEEAQNA